MHAGPAQILNFSRLRCAASTGGRPARRCRSISHTLLCFIAIATQTVDPVVVTVVSADYVVVLVSVTSCMVCNFVVVWTPDPGSGVQTTFIHLFIASLRCSHASLDPRPFWPEGSGVQTTHMHCTHTNYGQHAYSYMYTYTDLAVWQQRQTLTVLASSVRWGTPVSGILMSHPTTVSAYRTC